MRITNLKVQNFKAFYGEESEPYEFNFLGKDRKAKNILLYGENGSGKSSLYWTLYHVLNATNSQWFRKYKNIFAKKDGKNIKIVMNFDNGKSFMYDETTDELSVDEETVEEFVRATKIKTFLTYESIFLINELFEKSISIERFIYILDILYGESLHEQLQSYNHYRKIFKTKYLKQLCYLDQIFRLFDEEHNIKEFFNKMYDENVYYEDIEKWDKEENKPLKPFYETIYYYPDAMISKLENLKDSLEILRTDFDINSMYLDNLIESIEDVLYFMEEKSESHYQQLMEEEKIFVTDFIAIETVDEFVILEDEIESNISLIIEDYEIIQEIAQDLNDAINIKIDSQMAFINTILRNNFKSTIEIKYQEIDFFGYDINNLDNFNPLKFQVKTSDELMPHRYTKFLNEAKISSINFAFYLSIIKSYAELKELKLLVLDDLLISLDMSNRDIILDILQEQFSEYQIIFLTHDRAFFEMVKQKIVKNEWKTFEMFIHDNGEFDKPHIQISLDYFEKAEKHLREYDYSACANYLRKEVERIKKIKAAEEKASVPTDRSMKIIKQLIDSDDFINFTRPETTNAACIGTIRGKLIGVKNNLEQVREPAVEIGLKNIASILTRILHPQSHDDTSKPLYKKELQDAIQTVREIRDSLNNMSE